MRSSFTITLALCAGFFASTSTAAPRVDVMTQFVWSSESKAFGGLSGLEVDENGIGFTAISDTGLLYRGEFTRGTDGNIQSTALLQAHQLLFEEGKRPEAKRERDTEGLAITASKTLHMSAESKTRLLQYAPNETQPSVAPLPQLDDKTPTNMGFEALAVSPEGLLVAIPEGSANIRTPYKIYQQNNAGGWSTIYDLPRRGAFRPVGADFGPDGHLYVLTRAFNGFGFATHIERVLFSENAPISHETLFIGRFAQFDNLEGLAVWRAGPNDLRLVAVSDDNFSRLQSTEIVEFRLQE